MSEWKECTVNDICLDVYSGGTPKSGNAAYYGGEIPWLNTKEVNFCRIYNTEKTITQEGYDNSSAKWVPENAVIVAMYGATAGRVAITKIKLTTNQACCNLVVDTQKADYNYVYYYLLQNYAHIASMANGGAQQNLNAGQIKEYKIPLPPLAEQQRIADILSSLDDKIELNNQINDNLEKQAQALFKNWFIDYAPFGGVMPEDWIEGKLSDLAKITSGKRPPMKQSEKTNDVAIPLIGAASIMGFTNDFLYDEPVLVTGRVGTHGVIQRFVSKCWPSDNTLVVKSQYYEYVYQILKNIDFSNMNRGSTQPLITQSDLGKIECLVPSTSVLEKFETNAKSLFDIVSANCQETQRLTTLRDTLLPKLMSGEIDAEKV